MKNSVHNQSTQKCTFLDVSCLKSACQAVVTITATYLQNLDTGSSIQTYVCEAHTNFHFFFIWVLKLLKTYEFQWN